MSAIAMELEAMLKTLDATEAKLLEDDILALIEKAELDKKRRDEAMTLLRERKPYLAECVGAFADIDFQRPPQGELPPAKV